MINLFGKTKVVALLMILVMVFSLGSCGAGTKTDDAGPKGVYKNTLADKADDQGMRAVDESEGFGVMEFKPDGTGKWIYALENDIEWKIKGDKLTIIEKWIDSEHGDQEETYKATWNSEKNEFELDVWGLKYVFEKTDGGSSGEAAGGEAAGGEVTGGVVTRGEATGGEATGNLEPPTDSSLTGDYVGIGSEALGTKLDPNGEWLKLKVDGTGQWFLGINEESFTWTQEADKIFFEVSVEGAMGKLNYTGRVEDEERITLDVGMDYYFAKEGSPAAEEKSENPEDPGGESLSTDNVGWGIKPLGQIQIPAEWYGVAQITNCVGFDFEEVEYDVWGYTDKDTSGNSYFELWLDEDLTSHPILSFYIDEAETRWLKPVIGEGDSWVDIDDSGVDQSLTEDAEWMLMTEYIEGSLDIFHSYLDNEGRTADVRFFIREKGTGWREDVDPLPPSYDAYKAEYSDAIVD